MKAVWTVSSIIYLIIATVFILSSQFSQEAFAGADTSDLSRGEDADGSDLGDHGGADESDLSSNDHGGGARSASDLDSNDLGDTSTAPAIALSSNDHGGDGGEGSSASALSSNDHGGDGGADESDLSSNDHGGDGGANSASDLGGGKFWHNGQDIAMELSSLTPAEIRTYPLNDLSNNDVRLVLGFLSPSNLTKVLLNIPQENLLQIRDALTPVTFDQIINKLSETDKTKVENRFSVVSIN